MNKILFLLEDYSLFYTKGGKSALKKGYNYTQTLQELLSARFYQSNSMAAAFEGLGYETMVLVPECNPLQLRWAFENNIKLFLQWLIEKPIRSIKARFFKQYRTSYNSIQFKVLLAQISKFRPDFIYFYSNVYITDRQIQILKDQGSKVILQWTCPIWDGTIKFPYHHFDLVVTASLQLEEYFRTQKIKVKYIQQAFDTQILNDLDPISRQKQGDVVFIGSFSLGHEKRAEILEYLLSKGINLDVYGTGKEYLESYPLVQRAMKPPLFGIEMYNTYRKYMLALHIPTTGIAGDGINWERFAGAKRIFEITGAGTLLIASFQENLPELFDINREIIVFKSKQDLLLKINQILKDPIALEKIANAGQRRTIQSHSFQQRATILEKELRLLGKANQNRNGS